jgi:hypothetical protein
MAGAVRLPLAAAGEAAGAKAELLLALDDQQAHCRAGDGGPSGAAG